jgi:hypothetical protein
MAISFRYCQLPMPLPDEFVGKPVFFFGLFDNARNVYQLLSGGTPVTCDTVLINGCSG